MSRTVIEAIAWTLIHFLWQGAAIALSAGLVDAAFRGLRPSARHAVFSIALAVMAVAPAVTFVLVAGAPPVPAPSVVRAAAVLPAASAALRGSVAPAPLPDWPTWLVGFWIVGIAVLSLRSAGGFALAQRLARRATSPAAQRFQEAAARLRSRLDLRRPVRILASAAAEVPATIGWLRPVVLLPVSALTALPPEQIELLIAHELAHVKRRDYLVNLLQTAVETMLFYHPAVWWVGGHIRTEREHCCDDLAVAACGDAAAYAETLAALEGVRAARHALVVAASDGPLLARIKRLTSHPASRRERPPAWLGALIPAAAILTAVIAVAPPEVVAESTGYLRGLADAGYTKVSVDEIIALKENGVEPSYIKRMLAAGLGTLSVEQLIRLRQHGVEPEFAAGLVKSGLVSGLDVPGVIRLRENGVDPAEMGKIRGLGFGPYPSDDVVRLRQNGVDVETYQALKELGLESAGVAEAIEVRQNAIRPEHIRSMKRQGFNNLTLEQVIKLRRGGII